jgi:hypothetical protein
VSPPCVSEALGCRLLLAYESHNWDVYRRVLIEIAEKRCATDVIHELVGTLVALQSPGWTERTEARLAELLDAERS